MDTQGWAARTGAVLLGVAIGDALGAPVETKTVAEILADTAGRGVTGFGGWRGEDPPRRGHTPGATTDDFQLTCVVACALIEASGYDPEVMARGHVEAMAASSAGWGGTTKASVRELREWFDSNGAHGRSPQTPAGNHGVGRGGGNGVAMKVAPLACWWAQQVGEDEDARSLLQTGLSRDVRALAELTHDHADAYACAYALALVIAELTRRTRPLRAGAHLQVLGPAIAALRLLEGGAGQASTAALEKVSDILDEYAQGDRAGADARLREEITPGFSAITSVPYAIGVALGAPSQFRERVLRAVNDGGDADSTASMVGAIIAANCGGWVIPEEWAQYSSAFPRAGVLGRSLAEAGARATGARVSARQARLTG